MTKTEGRFRVEEALVRRLLRDHHLGRVPTEGDMRIELHRLGHDPKLVGKHIERAIMRAAERLGAVPA